nr:LytTR family DNA-binding domain-containing protein [uncultured Flavobacterium sp.]
MQYKYIIIDDDPKSLLETKAVADVFPVLNFVGSACNATDGLDLILENKPDIIFIEIDPVDRTLNLGLHFIDCLYKYLSVMPIFVVTTRDKKLAYDSFQYGVREYLIKPVETSNIVKFLLRLNKKNENEGIINEIATFHHQLFPKVSSVPEVQSLRLCIKSYGDYRYIDAKDICFLKADNNSTDIHLNNGELITAFKTLKYFETVLSQPFTRIHKSYIVNRNYISRIRSGNALCYIKNSNARIPYSKMYKANVDQIITDFANGNYLEI